MKLSLFDKLFLVLFVLLALFQLKTTNIKEAYSFTPHQISLQITRMNEYPPHLAHLGYLIEYKKQGQLLGKFASNFFTVTDFDEYFPNRLPYLTAPFFFIGLYVFAEKRKNWPIVFYTFLFSIFFLSLIGPHATHGPALIMPFLYFFIVLGFYKIIKFLWH